jgi:glucose dehydrogenase
LALAPAFAADIDWPTYGLDLSNQRYATPSQINTGNVGKLTRAWAYQSGVKATFQSTPIMVIARCPVAALQRRGGARCRHRQAAVALRTSAQEGLPLCCGPANRGVAVADGKVFIGTVDARLVALDAKTGKVLWDVEVADADSARQGP